MTAPSIIPCRPFGTQMQWVDGNFQKCDLGDAQRTKRLVKVAESMVDAPDESLPGQRPDWADLKATIDCSN
jgi:hypothetical protein